MFEVSELSGGKAEYFEKIRVASMGWDGKDPVRLPSSLA
jgi:predicted sulfurtransferase